MKRRKDQREAVCGAICSFANHRGGVGDRGADSCDRCIDEWPSLTIGERNSSRPAHLQHGSGHCRCLSRWLTVGHSICSSFTRGRGHALRTQHRIRHRGLVAGLDRRQETHARRHSELYSSGAVHGAAVRASTRRVDHWSDVVGASDLVAHRLVQRWTGEHRAAVRPARHRG